MKNKEPIYIAREWFVDFHKRTERFAIVIAARRVGKTVATVADSVMFAYNCKLPDPRIIYIAPFKDQAKKVAWDYYMKYTAGLPIKVTRSQLKIEFLHNGATIELAGGENMLALKGRYFDYVVVDEVAQMKDGLYGEVIRPTIADRNGKIVFIGTVRGRNTFWQLWKSVQDEPYCREWFRKLLKITDTTALPEKEILALKEQMSKEDFEQEMMCNPDSAIKGAFYGDEMSKVFEEGRVGDFDYNRAYPVHTFWDLGFVDSVVIIFVQVYDNKIFIIDYYKNAQKVISHYLDHLKTKPYNYKQHHFPHDVKARTLSSQGVSLVEQIAQELDSSLISILPQHKLLDGINAGRVALKRTYFNEKNTIKLVEALQLYRREWDGVKMDFKNNELVDWTNHGADAFRYLAMNYSAETRRMAERNQTQIFAPKHYTLDELFKKQKNDKINYERI